MKTTIKTLALVGLVAAAGAASAQTSAGTLTNQLTITATCAMVVDGGTSSNTSIQSVTKSMGTVAQAATPLNTSTAGTGGSSTMYSVSCGTGVTYSLVFDEGQNKDSTSSAAIPARRVALSYGTPAAKDYIAYNLYNGSSTTPVGNATITGATGATVYTINGKVTDTSNSNTHHAGTYSDLVNVTLSYS